MQAKNLLLWVFVSAAFVGGMFLLDRVFPPPLVDNKEGEPTLSAAESRERAIGLVTGGGGIPRLPIKTPEAVASKPKATRADQIGLVAGRIWSPPAPPVARPNAAKTFTLGSRERESEFHLFVQLTQYGAGVRELVLNKFEEANRLGRGTTDPLTLVPVDDRVPSYLLYHFDVNSPKSDRPLDTLGKINWEPVLKDGNAVQNEENQQSISFAAEIQGFRVVKTFTLRKAEYHLGLQVSVERRSAREGLPFRYQLTGAHGLPVEGEWYTTTFRHALIGRVRQGDLLRDYQELREIAKTNGGEQITREEGKQLQYAGIAVQYFASVVVVDDQQENREFLASARPTLETRVVTVEISEPITGDTREVEIVDKSGGRMVVVRELSDDARVVLAGMKKGEKADVVCVPLPQSAGSKIDAPENLRAVRVYPQGKAQPLFLDDITVRLNSEPIDVGTKQVEHKYLLYNGPVKPRLLGQMSGAASVPDDVVTRYVDVLRLNTLTDYHSPNWFGRVSNSIGWSSLLIFFTNVMHRVLGALHLVLPNYGVAIILLTFLVRGLMFPVSRKQAITSIKMQALAPELKKLREKHKENPQEFQSQMMGLYRKHGVNPFGSCWLLLLQMPIFMGLYYALQESIHFRLAGFLWIENLAAPDMLIPWGEGIPWLTRPEDYGGLLYLGPYLNFLPIVAVALMILQQQLMMPPALDEQQMAQQKMMKYMMIFFGIMFYKVAAGLCLYFIVSSLWGFAERKLLPKQAKSVTPTDTPPATSREEPPASPPPASENGSSTLNRTKKKEERKQKSKSGGNSSDNVRAQQATSEKGGMLQSLRDWWQDVLKKAAKK